MLNARVTPRWESENNRMATVEGLPTEKIPKIRTKLHVWMFLWSSYKHISRGGQRRRDTELRRRGVEF